MSLNFPHNVLLHIKHGQCPFEGNADGFEIGGTKFFRNRTATGSQGIKPVWVWVHIRKQSLRPQKGDLSLSPKCKSTQRNHGGGGEREAIGTLTDSIPFMSCQAHWKYKRPLDLEFDPASLNLEFLGGHSTNEFHSHLQRQEEVT